jgi:uncharacterized protein
MLNTRYPLSRVIATLFVLTCGLSVHAQSINPNYDKNLADSLGGDDYGMKQYMLVILKTGSVVIKDKSITDSLFRGHMKNINRLAESGKLIVAGPMQKNDKAYRGIFILNVKSIEEARALLDIDPAIKAKVLDSEVYGWYGSAALPMYLDFHKKVEKKGF